MAFSPPCSSISAHILAAPPVVQIADQNDGMYDSSRMAVLPITFTPARALHLIAVLL
eukprot:CAMPEP_0181178456 /NCGR_PEP_ID=MMETSP1096-20121128/5733_1 /TAXON_ID=156174 ORGANISM="Chrysochromulina ericina, Strain CCMP281" /NCGR_SAMPLE_ID=MMETSP1096 /ASSEMBLY_ACC=CAM_ASM_000453 /LENGTH=56 /DNA_ID=CAMNT_0023266733 /DNA_START=332 /DNA_END=502 /DNA_ORIENTATION=+